MKQQPDKDDDTRTPFDRFSALAKRIVTVRKSKIQEPEREARKDSE